MAVLINWRAHTRTYIRASCATALNYNAIADLGDSYVTRKYGNSAKNPSLE